MDVFDPWSSSGAGGSGGDVPLYGGVWMNVCSKEFSEKEAQVVCRELECGNDSEHVQRVHPNRYSHRLHCHTEDAAPRSRAITHNDDQIARARVCI